MADFVAVLKKTIDGLGETTPEIRQRVYEKARATIAAKLAQISPPPSAAAVERQKKVLDDAIVVVEAQYEAAEAEPEPAPAPPADELEAVLESFGQPPVRPVPAQTIVPPPAAASHRADPVPAASPPAAAPIPAALAPQVPPSSHAAKDDLAAPTPSAFFGVEDAWTDPTADDFDLGVGPAIAPPAYRAERRRGGAGRWIAAFIVLLIVAAAAYGYWFRRAELVALLGSHKHVVASRQVAANSAAREPSAMPTASQPVTAPASKPAAAGNSSSPPPATAAHEAASPAPVDTANGAKPAGNPAPDGQSPAAKPAGQPPARKFTQRLAADGTETNPGPGGSQNQIGEGSSVATATAAQPATAPAAQPATTPAGEATPTTADNEQVPVAQHAIFYEEQTNASQGSARPGTTVWSLVKESPGGDLPPEPAIRAEVTIPGKDVQLRMTIRRNVDKTLPASDIVELIFLTPDKFEGGGIDSVLRVSMKDTEQAAGSPLLGIPAKIADGFFLIALNDGKAAVSTNTALLRNEDWIDIPIVYKSGRRALITMEKGITGSRVFDEALKAWANLSTASNG